LIQAQKSFDEKQLSEKHIVEILEIRNYYEIKLLDLMNFFISSDEYQIRFDSINNQLLKIQKEVQLTSNLLQDIKL
jgi:hypothetical protein